MIVAQLSDLHITPPGAPAFGLVATGPYTERAIAQLNALTPRPDCVVISGDLADNGSPDEYALLAGYLDGLAIPYYLATGNHDRPDAMRAGLRGPWPATGDLHYTVDDAGPVRLVALDTNVPGEARGELTADRLGWLADALAAAPDRPTALFMHHPPFPTGIEVMDGIGLTGADALADLVAAHPQVVALWCGHLHRSVVSRVAHATATCCPSVAHGIGLDLAPGAQLAVVMEPPAFQLHVWQPARSHFLTHHVPIAQGDQFERLVISLRPSGGNGRR